MVMAHYGLRAKIAMEPQSAVQYVLHVLPTVLEVRVEYSEQYIEELCQSVPSGPSEWREALKAANQHNSAPNDFYAATLLNDIMSLAVNDRTWSRIFSLVRECAVGQKASISLAASSQNHAQGHHVAKRTKPCQLCDRMGRSTRSRSRRRDGPDFPKTER
jgi:hypothetical protein